MRNAAVCWCVALISAIQAWAGPVDELLAMEHRPTIADLKDKLQPWPAQNPFHSAAEPARPAGDIVRDSGPQIIAALEFAYPGAIWAPLGRDSAAAGDALDAFYQSIGQADRVSRLNASTNALKNADHATLIRFLESAGLNLDPQAPNARPFIMLDTTSYKATSQSTRLLEAGYQEWIKRGGNPADLFRRFNLVSLGDRYGNNYLEPGFDMQKFFSELTTNSIEAQIEDLTRRYMRQGQPPQHALYYAKMAAAGMPTGMCPLMILAIDPDRFAQVRGKFWSYPDVFWHDTFESLSIQNGKLTGVAGRAVDPMGHPHNRRAVLSDMYDVVMAVSEPTFLPRVKQKATEFGYAFTGEAVALKLAEPLSAPEARLAVAELVHELGPVVHADGEYLSANAQALKRWLDRQATARDYVTVIPAFALGIADAHQTGRIGDRDFRRLFRFALARAPEFSTDLEHGLREAVLGSESLREMAVGKAEFFLRQEDQHDAHSITMFQALEQKILKTAECEAKLVRARAS
jgi:hypothetical protein